MTRNRLHTTSLVVFLFFSHLMMSCAGPDAVESGEVELRVPRGYVSVLAIEKDGRRYFFGPFVGYYFKPVTPENTERLRFVCFNEQGFYTDSLAVNTKLYEGEAVFRKLPGAGEKIPAVGGRIRPVFFADAPSDWLDSRPQPQEEFVHFHSCRNDRGPLLFGYWLLHRAVADFTYNMGGRLGPESVLHHQVIKGVDRNFAPIIEFDFGKP